MSWKEHTDSHCYDKGNSFCIRRGDLSKGSTVGVVGAWGQNSFEGQTGNTTATNIQLSLTFFSSVFGDGQEKYFPLSAMNGFRLVRTLNAATNCTLLTEIIE